jgi:hypothetical protein
MQYNIEAGTGIKNMQLGANEVVRITSDHHIPPKVLTGLCNNLLIGSPLSDFEAGYRWFQDIFNVGGPGVPVTHHYLNGDWGHLAPEHRSSRKHNAFAMQTISDVICERGLTGAQLTLNPGNHSPIESIPPDQREQLINRGILVPSGHSILRTTGAVEFDIKHGHEDDGTNRGIVGGNTHWMQELFRHGLNTIRHATRTAYFPYNTPVMETISTIMDAFQQINAEADLPEGSWAVRSHTHFPKLSPPHPGSLEEPENMMSLDYLHSLVTGNHFAQALLTTAARIAPELTGINRRFLAHNHKIGYLNSGLYDPLSQVLSLADISNSEVALRLAKVNGGYTTDMLNRIEDNAIITTGRIEI